MLTIRARQILFFSILLLGFFIGVKITNYWISKGDLDKDIVILLTSVFFVMFSAGIYFIASMDKLSEGFWDIDPSLKCMGGAYMYTGDSDYARKCQAMASTPEGKCAIDATSCGEKGIIGRPGLGFEYTPLSDDNYHNARCDGGENCRCGQVDMKPWNI